jgi:hypothetical protein
MKGFENETFLLLYIISNVLAITLLILAALWPKLTRLLFFTLFLWASFTNWNGAIKTPDFYTDYANLTFLNVYKEFIEGWFSQHVVLAVGFIATAQALIAISMLLRGAIYKLGIIGGIIFLIAIIPLGAGSAFPCTLITAIALRFLWKQDSYIWQHNAKGKLVVAAH